MKKIAFAMLCLTLLPMRAMAQPVPPLAVTVNSPSAFTQSSSVQTGFFDIIAVVDPQNLPPATNGFSVTVDGAGTSGVAFLTPTATDASSPTRAQLLSGNMETPNGGALGDPNTASHASGDAVNLTATQAFSNGIGLIRVPFSIAPNAVGTFNLTIDESAFATNFTNGSTLGSIPFSVKNGAITISPAPEPGTASVLLVGAAGALVRRKR